MKEYRSDLHRFGSFFQEYNHHIPVIYSTVEGQYDGAVYLNEEETIAILVTGFGFIFVGGDYMKTDSEEMVHDLIFNYLVEKEQLKEIMMFAPNEGWNLILDKVFERHHGVKDYRHCFKLNNERFKEKLNDLKSMEHKLILESEQENGSKIPYPVANLYIGNDKASFCSAFMITNNYAEIDVGTSEEYRNHGYAQKAAFLLIKHLVEQEVEPNWCTWPYRIESQKLALSVGFELEKEVLAHIWVEDFGL